MKKFGTNNIVQYIIAMNEIKEWFNLFRLLDINTSNTVAKQ